MSTRPTIITADQLEAAAKNTDLLALDDRQLVSVSGGALIPTDPGTTIGYYEPPPSHL